MAKFKQLVTHQIEVETDLKDSFKSINTVFRDIQLHDATTK